MRGLIGMLLIAAFMPLAWYAAYPNKPRLHAMARVVKRKTIPCRSPVSYSIGEIDPRFGVSVEELYADLTIAEAVWEEPSGRNLFEYKASSGDITVSLIYDMRQAASDKLKAMGIRTDRGRESYEFLKSRYQALLALVDSGQARNSSKLAAYKLREAGFNAAMRRYNSGGGSAAERRRLELRRAALARELAGINELEAGINKHIDTLNALATMLNQLIVQLNLNVKQYNRAGASLGSFEAGFYRMSWGLEAIDIYSYTDRIQLARLLAHEMGHSLGIDHLQDPDAVMYHINRGVDLRAGPADIAALNTACKPGLRRRRY